jgi:hypothetical protein
MQNYLKKTTKGNIFIFPIFYRCSAVRNEGAKMITSGLETNSISAFVFTFELEISSCNNNNNSSNNNNASKKTMTHSNNNFRVLSHFEEQKSQRRKNFNFLLHFKAKLLNNIIFANLFRHTWKVGLLVSA